MLFRLILVEKLSIDWLCLIFFACVRFYLIFAISDAMYGLLALSNACFHTSVLQVLRLLVSFEH